MILCGKGGERTCGVCRGKNGGKSGTCSTDLQSDLLPLKPLVSKCTCVLFWYVHSERTEKNSWWT